VVFDSVGFGRKVSLRSIVCMCNDIYDMNTHFTTIFFLHHVPRSLGRCQWMSAMSILPDLTM